MNKSETNPQPVNSNKQSFVRRWTKRILIGITGLIIVLLITGLVFQYAATKIDEGKYPAPGKMIEMDGYRLHLNCNHEVNKLVRMAH